MLGIHSGSFLTISVHGVKNSLKIKSLALCFLMKLISVLIHNKAFILLSGQGLTTLIIVVSFPAWLQLIESPKVTIRTDCFLKAQLLPQSNSQP